MARARKISTWKEDSEYALYAVRQVKTREMEYIFLNETMYSNVQRKSREFRIVTNMPIEWDPAYSPPLVQSLSLFLHEQIQGEQARNYKGPETFNFSMARAFEIAVFDLPAPAPSPWLFQVKGSDRETNVIMVPPEAELRQVDCTYHSLWFADPEVLEIQTDVLNQLLRPHNPRSIKEQGVKDYKYNMLLSMAFRMGLIARRTHSYFAMPLSQPKPAARVDKIKARRQKVSA